MTSQGEPAEPAAAWREALTRRLTVMLACFSLGAALAVWFLVRDPLARSSVSGVGFAFALVLAGCRWARPSRAAPPWLLVGGMIPLLYSSVAFAGLLAGSAMAVATTVILASLLLDGRGFALVTVLTLGGVVVIGWAMTTQRLPPPPPHDVSFERAEVWLRTGVIAILLLVVCVTLVRGALMQLEATLVRLQQEGARREAAEAARQQAQDSLLGAQKLEAVGQVAAGIAHDFNNLLAIVGSHAARVLARTDPGSAVRKDLEVIGDVVAGGAGLTRQLLLFSRRQRSAPEVVRPDDRVRALTRLMVTLAQGARVEVRCGAADAHVVIDPSQLEQVVMNLVLNARDATRDAGGTIEVTTAVADRHVILTVSDDGGGMDAATRSRAFEPLFTTKPLGMGTGLGLSTVQLIVTQAGGDVHLVSESGRGTCVTVRLPLSSARAEVPESPVASLPVASVGLRPVILLVDDEDKLRDVLATFLDEEGLDVRPARSGAAALALAAGLGRLDGVVSDVSMPGTVGGDELIRQLRAERPGLPALLISGFVGPRVDIAALGLPPVAILAKPFSPQDLVAAVRTMLAGSV